MSRYGGKSAARKKKFCAALMISLLIGGVCSLQGEAALEESAGYGNLSGTECPEEKTEDSDQETAIQKISATESSENEIPDLGILEEDATDPEETGGQETESPVMDASDQESSSTEPSEAETQKPEGTDTDNTEPDPSVAEPSETEAPKPDTSETEASGQNEPKTQEPMETEPETSGSEIPETALSQEEPSGEKAPGLICLQIPEKLEVVIDPWEIDGKTQIYSKPFAVKNTGDVPGVLTLSFTCNMNEGSGVSVQETKEGLHDSEDKLLYLKVILENGAETIFSEEGAECRAVLPPGEKLSLWFEGEVNENAEEPWVNGDLEIEGKYSWEEEELQPEKIAEKDMETEKEADQEEGQPIMIENRADDTPVQPEKEPAGERDTSAESEREQGEESLAPEDPGKEPAGETAPPEETENGSAGERDPSGESEKDPSEETLAPEEPEKEPDGETASPEEPESGPAEKEDPSVKMEQEADQNPDPVGETLEESLEDSGLSESSPKEE